MADEVEMVVIDGVRYRKEDAPKVETKRDEDTKPAENKMRTTRTKKK